MTNIKVFNPVGVAGNVQTLSLDEHNHITNFTRGAFIQLVFDAQEFYYGHADMLKAVHDADVFSNYHSGYKLVIEHYNYLANHLRHPGDIISYNVIFDVHSAIEEMKNYDECCLDGINWQKIDLGALDTRDESQSLLYRQVLDIVCAAHVLNKYFK